MKEVKGKKRKKNNKLRAQTPHRTPAAVGTENKGKRGKKGNDKKKENIISYVTQKSRKRETDMKQNNKF